MSDQATATSPSSARLRAFVEKVWTAFVPKSGPCLSIQGELVRAHGRLSAELLGEGMGNYYDEQEEVAENHFGQLMLLILEVLTANRGGALGAEDVAFFEDVRRRLDGDRARALRLRALEQADPIPDAAQDELESLGADHPDAIAWETFLDRAERCIANWCIANHALTNRVGQPVEERGGVKDLLHLFEPPPAPPACPLCGGKGFIQPEKASGWPKLCTCQTAKAP